jgi:NADPH-dependent 7-cyano-7-deazaguanine reductase QueF
VNPPIESVINDIIIKSEQLLLRLDEFYNSEEVEEDKINELLVSLKNEREQLLHKLFDQYSKEQIQIHIFHINQIIALDESLNAKSQKIKQSFSKKLISLKKGKKKANAYQKY